MLRYLCVYPVSAASVVNVAGVIPRPAPLPWRLAAGLGHQQGRVRGTPGTVSPVQVGLTAAALELKQQSQDNQGGVG